MPSLLALLRRPLAFHELKYGSARPTRVKVSELARVMYKDFCPFRNKLGYDGVHIIYVGPDMVKALSQMSNLDWNMRPSVHWTSSICIGPK